MMDEEIRLAAIEFAKRNKNRIAKELTDKKKYLPDTIPVSAFMAGSPGAGKTEFSKSLIKTLEENSDRRVVRIDGDEVRPLIPGYTGNNSHLFQGAISLIVEKMHDMVLHQKQSFVLDSTFAKYEKAVSNIRRSLERNRPVFIFYIYQRPEVAWKFTHARELAEGRNIPKLAFIEQFLGAGETVKRISDEFRDSVVVFFVKKDFERNTVENIVKIEPDKAQVDDYVRERYTKRHPRKMLTKLLKLLTRTDPSSLAEAEQKEKPGRFSDFFLHVSEKEREEVLREAARKANEEQRKMFTKSYLKAEAP